MLPKCECELCEFPEKSPRCATTSYHSSLSLCINSSVPHTHAHTPSKHSTHAGGGGGWYNDCTLYKGGTGTGGQMGYGSLWFEAGRVLAAA